MNNGTLIVAYHGCDILVRDDLVTGKLKALKPSANNYDWLGGGIYFFEGDAKRAQKFAEASHKNPEKFFTAKPIGMPAVVGAILRVSNCLDMTTQAGHDEYIQAYNAAKVGWDRLPEEERPVNRPASKSDLDIIYRELDSEVINLIHKSRMKQGLPAYEMVRGAFQQGDPLATSSAFHDDTHVQLAVRNEDCIVGWFLPGEEKLMAEDERLAAEFFKKEAEQKRSEFKRAAGRRRAAKLAPV